MGPEPPRSPPSTANEVTLEPATVMRTACSWPVSSSAAPNHAPSSDAPCVPPPPPLPPPHAASTARRSARASQYENQKSRSNRSMSPSLLIERGGILGARAPRENWTEVRKRLAGSPSRKARRLAAQRREYCP